MEPVTAGTVASWSELVTKHGLPIVLSVVAIVVGIAIVAVFVSALKASRRRDEEREALLSAQLEERHEQLWNYFTQGDGNVSGRLADVSAKLDSIRAMMMQLQATVEEHSQRLGQGDFRFGALEERQDKIEVLVAEMRVIVDDLKSFLAECPRTSGQSCPPKPRRTKAVVQ